MGMQAWSGALPESVVQEGWRFMRDRVFLS